MFHASSRLRCLAEMEFMVWLFHQRYEAHYSEGTHCPSFQCPGSRSSRNRNPETICAASLQLHFGNGLGKFFHVQTPAHAQRPCTFCSVDVVQRLKCRLLVCALSSCALYFFDVFRWRESRRLIRAHPWCAPDLFNVFHRPEFHLLVRTNLSCTLYFVDHFHWPEANRFYSRTIVVCSLVRWRYSSAEISSSNPFTEFMSPLLCQLLSSAGILYSYSNREAMRSRFCWSLSASWTLFSCSLSKAFTPTLPAHLFASPWFLSFLLFLL